MSITLTGTPFQFYQFRDGDRVQADASGNVTVTDPNDVMDLLNSGCTFPAGPTGTQGPTGPSTGFTGPTGASSTGPTGATGP
jgi:hypothetical protein